MTNHGEGSKKKDRKEGWTLVWLWGHEELAEEAEGVWLWCAWATLPPGDST
jgi:hypothetical protein